MKEYKVYITDADGSERLGCTVFADSVRQAKSIARNYHITPGVKISSVEPKA
jgi:hypothetical protein